ncbi:hypothetical protein [Breznakiella homolactica]|uniref:Uncharacterized protein n=1 Tax=Breznakiella homolactica TaxID=2798577 RepID=A0A7T7XNZ2_9SPIR|nr:hypothetical protein [Breznakiella homolactica]QQO09821.1 hypothetical protein JFL75_02615 [Breznakiella homolactica]
MYQSESIKKNSLHIYFFCVLILPSPFLNYIGLTGMSESIIILILSSPFFFFLYKGKKWVILSILLMLMICSITAFYYKDIKLIIINFILISYLVLHNILNHETLEDFVDLASNFFLVMLIFCWVGLIYSLKGGLPTGTIINPDTRPNYWYLTTFSNVRFGKLIRPSGIYDEPGALSFFIISIVLLRLYLNKIDKKNILLLILGCVTFSLAHLLFSVLIYFYIHKRISFKSKVLYDIVLIISIIIFFLVMFDAINALVLERLKFNSNTGRFVGDNRSIQLKAVFHFLSENGIFWGAYGYDNVFKEYGTIGENPLTRLALDGLFVSLPYYFGVLIMSIAVFFSSKRMLIFVMILLFLQRPYLSSIGYSAFFILFFRIAINELQNNKNMFFFVK